MVLSGCGEDLLKRSLSREVGPTYWLAVASETRKVPEVRRFKEGEAYLHLCT